MVFLRPVVMRDAGVAEPLSLDRYDADPRAAAERAAGAEPRCCRSTSRRCCRRCARRPSPPQPLRRTAAAPHGAGAAAAPPTPTPPAAPLAREQRPWRARHPLPYAFAKANTLLLEDDGAQLRAVGRRQRADVGAGRGAAPVRRRSARARGRRTLAQRIAAAYAGGESSAAAVIGEVESAVDLIAHDAGPAGGRRPARSGQRRADHPHAQRAADAGREGRRERHPHRAVRAIRARCASASTARCARWCSRTGRCTRR